MTMSRRKVAKNSRRKLSFVAYCNHLRLLFLSYSLQVTEKKSDSGLWLRFRVTFSAGAEMIDSKKFARAKVTALRVRYANKSTQRRCDNASIVIT